MYIRKNVECLMFFVLWLLLTLYDFWFMSWYEYVMPMAWHGYGKESFAWLVYLLLSTNVEKKKNYSCVFFFVLKIKTTITFWKIGVLTILFGSFSLAPLILHQGLVQKGVSLFFVYFKRGVIRSGNLFICFLYSCFFRLVYFYLFFVYFFY